ncbi:MAG: hypothetical protein K6A36_07950 [Paludibacteraceae bacterium]|nr:hypothetical protein [Paludibacteraceae bacterium]
MEEHSTQYGVSHTEPLPFGHNMYTATERTSDILGGLLLHSTIYISGAKVQKSFYLCKQHTRKKIEKSKNPNFFQSGKFGEFRKKHYLCSVK